MGSASVSGVMPVRLGLSASRRNELFVLQDRYGDERSNTEPEIVTRNGKPVSAILPIKKYQQMIERLEDAADVAWLKRARRKKLHFRPLEQVLADLPKR